MAGMRFVQAIEYRRNGWRVAEEIVPELIAHFVAEIGNLLQRTGVTLGDTQQLHIFQSDKFMLRHGKFAPDAEAGEYRMRSIPVNDDTVQASGKTVS